MNDDTSIRVISWTTFEYPSRFAHPIHSLEMARAFSSILGRDRFLFVIAKIRDNALLDGMAYKTLFGRVSRVIRKLGLRTLLQAFLMPLFFIGNTRRATQTILFINDLPIGVLACLYAPLFGFKVVFEVHALQRGALARFVYSHAALLVCVTEALRQEVRQFAVSEDRLIVLPNAVDVERFETTTLSKEALREELGLPSKEVIIGYIGRFHPGAIDKGIGLLLDALKALPASYRLLLVGGSADEILHTQTEVMRMALAHRVTLVAHVDTRRVPQYAKACDVLVYAPQEGEGAFFSTETSPMKIYEYMAARRPMVLSAVPTLREIVSSDMAWFVSPGSATSLAEGIVVAIEDVEGSAKRVAAAGSEVATRTWKKRAESIISSSSILQ